VEQAIDGGTDNQVTTTFQKLDWDNSGWPADQLSTRRRKAPAEQPIRCAFEERSGWTYLADKIMVNAEKAQFADLVVFRQSQKRVMLVQCKRFLESYLTSRKMREELVKMGCVPAADVVLDVAERFPNRSMLMWESQVSEYLVSRGISDPPTADGASRPACALSLVHQLPRDSWRAALEKRINERYAIHPVVGDRAESFVFVPDVATQRAKETARVMRCCDALLKEAKDQFFNQRVDEATASQFASRVVNENIASACEGTTQQETFRRRSADFVQDVVAAMQHHDESLFRGTAMQRVLEGILTTITGGSRSLGLLHTLASELVPAKGVARRRSHPSSVASPDDNNK
jgi:hypothetical protein